MLINAIGIFVSGMKIYGFPSFMVFAFSQLSLMSANRKSVSSWGMAEIFCVSILGWVLFVFFGSLNYLFPETYMAIKNLEMILISSPMFWVFVFMLMICVIW